MTASEEAPARWGELFRQREFRALFAAGLLSVAGDQIARVALSILVYERTGSASLTALTYALTFVPDLLFGPLLSGIADRLPRRRVMIATDIARAVLVAAMAVHGLSLVTVMVLLVGVQALTAPFNAARAATLAAVLRGDDYVLGKAANDMVIQISQVLGFGVGGVLVAAIGSSQALLIDAATFVVSAAFIAGGLLPRPAPERTAEESGGWLRDLVAGTALVARTPRLRILIALGCIAGFYITVDGIAVPYAEEIGGGASAAGLLFAASPAGCIVGMWLLTRCAPSTRLKLMGPLAVCACLPLVLCAARPGLVMTTILWALSGMASAYHLPASAAFIRAVPDHRRGQAFGVASTALKTSQGAGVLGVGVVADQTAPSTAIAVIATAGVLAAIAAAMAWSRTNNSE